MTTYEPTYRSTVPCKPPLPFAHMTMTDRFGLYDTLTAHGMRALPRDGHVATWAVLVGLVGSPQPLANP